MAKNDNNSSKVMTPMFRVSFPEVFAAKSYNNNEPKFSISMLFDKKAQKSPAFAEMKRIAREAIQAKWGNKKPANLRTPFRDGGEKELDGYGEGIIFVNASSKYKPGIVDRDRQDIISQEDFYPGCYARATVTCYAYDTQGNRGVAFGLHNLQKLKDGESFSGRAKAEDDFSDSDASAFDDDDLDAGDDDPLG